MSDRNAGQNLFSRNITLLVMSVAVLLVIAAVTLLVPQRGVAPSEEEISAQSANASDVTKVAEGAELLQTLRYTRCEHVVTRRVTAPVELYGKTLEEVQPLYETWRVTEFSPSEIKMEQRPDLFCPDHVVLMTNGAGALCVFENRYGDALALVSELETRLDTLPAAIQEEIADGVGFSSLTELEQWLESVES